MSVKAGLAHLDKLQVAATPQPWTLSINGLKSWFGLSDFDGKWVARHMEEPDAAFAAGALIALTALRAERSQLIASLKKELNELKAELLPNEQLETIDVLRQHDKQLGQIEAYENVLAMLEEEN